MSCSLSVLFIVILLCFSGIRSFSIREQNWILPGGGVLRKNKDSNFKQQSESQGDTVGRSLCRSSMNPFIQTLLQGGVLLNKEPSRESNKCGEEWKMYGSCCEETSLLKYAKEDSSLFRIRSMKFITELKHLLKGIKISMFRLKRRDGGPNKNSLLKLARHPGKYSLKYLKGLFERIKGFNKLEQVFLESKDTILNTQSACINKLVELRSSSLCGTCSSRSGVFFVKGRALMPFSTCRSVIETCHNYWTALLRVVHTATRLESLITHAKKFLKFPPSTKSLQFLAEWTIQNNLKDGLKNCTTLDICSQEHASSICSSLIKIKSQETVEASSSDFISMQAAKFEQFGSQSDSPADAEDSETSFAAKRRILENLFQLPGPQPIPVSGLFQTELMVVPDHYNVSAKTPMNFDSLFP